MLVTMARWPFGEDKRQLATGENWKQGPGPQPRKIPGFWRILGPFGPGGPSGGTGGRPGDTMGPKSLRLVANL